MTAKRCRCNRVGGGVTWPACSSCDGRIHLPECTTHRTPMRDCCLSRHRMLHDAGQTKSFWDDSRTMLESAPPGPKEDLKR